MFDVPNSLGLDNRTLLQALNFGGGNGPKGAAQTLLRSAVAALLNAALGSPPYPLTEAQIIADVNAALTGTRTTMLALATTLDNYNNLATRCHDV